MDKKSIKTLIEEALKELIKRDIDLIHRKVREECINHRLACYLEQFLSEYKCCLLYTSPSPRDRG